MFGTLFNNMLAAMPVFLAHFGVALAMLLIGVLIYQWATPINEARLIREGNTAAATSFGAAVLGMAMPMAFCLSRGVNAADIALWGVVAIVIQLATYFAISILFRDLEKRIERGEMAAAVALGSTKLAVAALNAAATA